MLYPHDPSNFEELLKHLTPQFKARAKKLERWASQSLDHEDLLQEARLGAWQAWVRHKDNQEWPMLRLISVMAMRGKGAMMDFMDQTNWTGRHRPSQDPDKITVSNFASLDGEDVQYDVPDESGSPDDHLYAKQMVEHLLYACRPYRSGVFGQDRNKHHLDVLQLIAQGFECKEISETLSLSRFRVERILSEIRRKAESMP